MTYRLITILLWPALFIYTLKIALRDKSKRYFFQRLGWAYRDNTYNETRGKSIWIHCASVGEVNTYMPLHKKLLQTYPNHHFIITTNTTTGAATVQRHNTDRTTHYYLPIESSSAIKRFLKASQASQCLIMETEIWPLLYQRCYDAKLPIKIINARLSHRTLNTNVWLKNIYQSSLKRVDTILCKSEIELSNFKTLGARQQQLVVAGNLKFTITANNTQAIDLNNRTYCVAASTHNDEELQLARLWKKIKTKQLLVIIPRHPNRSESIQKQLDALNINYAVRSKQQTIDADTTIYLADTLGELTEFMAGANFVFIGGSLIKHGGQNILEAAALGKASLCGPHMYNFKDELTLLLTNNACIQVDDIKQLEETIIECLHNKQRVKELGINAKEALHKQNGVLDCYLENITL